MSTICDQSSFEDWLEFIKDESNSPEAAEAPTGVNADIIKKAAHLYAIEVQFRWLRVTEHSQGSTMVMAGKSCHGY